MEELRNYRDLLINSSRNRDFYRQEIAIVNNLQLPTPSSATTDKMGNKQLVKWTRNSTMPHILRFPQFMRLSAALSNLKPSNEAAFPSSVHLYNLWVSLRQYYHTSIETETNKTIGGENQKTDKMMEYFPNCIKIPNVVTVTKGNKNLVDNDSLISVGRIDVCSYIKNIGYPLMVMKVKNEEHSSSHSEKLAQAFTYYLQFVKGKQAKYKYCGNIPCLVLTLTGTVISVHGAMMYDALSPIATACECYIGSFNVAPSDSYLAFQIFWMEILTCMQQLYNKIICDIQLILSEKYNILDQDRFPAFRDLDSLGLRFQYIAPLCDTKRVFEARRVSNDSVCKLPQHQNLIVKLIQGNYCETAHQLLASDGFAPQLFGVIDTHHNGWKLIIMEEIVDTDTRLVLNDEVQLTLKHKQKEQEALTILHDAGFIHGDLRSCNIVFTINRNQQQHNEDESEVEDEVELYIIDFDWAGKHNIQRYPHEMNSTLPWTDNATPGELLRFDHDIYLHNRRYEHLLQEGGEEYIDEEYIDDELSRELQTTVNITA